MRSGRAGAASEVSSLSPRGRAIIRDLTYWTGYRHLKKDFPHAFVSHAKKQYVDGVVHTQTIDSFWSLLKRSFHKASRKYLPLYVAEFQFRYNNRTNADIFGAAIAMC